MIYQPGDTLLEQYRIDRLAGLGGFGEIYQVTNERLKRTEAVKVLRSDMPGIKSEEFSKIKDQFTLEARLGAQLDHPNVIKVYNFQENQGELYLIMEYAAQGSLAAQLLRDEVFSVERVVRLGVELCSGLTAIHQILKAVHRDIKPSNILFGADGIAKISDLGLVQLSSDLSNRTQLGSLAERHPGTPLYMSPEQANTNGYLQPSSDIFSVGCVLFEVVTRIQYQTVYGTHAREHNPEIPLWLDEIIDRALAEIPARRPGEEDDPSKRYRTAALMQKSLEAAWQAKLERMLKGFQKPPEGRIVNEKQEPVRVESKPQLQNSKQAASDIKQKPSMQPAAIEQNKAAALRPPVVPVKGTNTEELKFRVKKILETFNGQNFPGIVFGMKDTRRALLFPKYDEITFYRFNKVSFLSKTPNIPMDILANTDFGVHIESNSQLFLSSDWSSTGAEYVSLYVICLSNMPTDYNLWYGSLVKRLSLLNQNSLIWAIISGDFPEDIRFQYQNPRILTSSLLDIEVLELELGIHKGGENPAKQPAKS